MNVCLTKIMSRKSKLQKSIFMISQDKQGSAVVTNSPCITEFYFLLMLHGHHWPDGVGGISSSLWNPAGGAAALWKLMVIVVEGKEWWLMYWLLKLLAESDTCPSCFEPQFLLKWGWLTNRCLAPGWTSQSLLSRLAFLALEALNAKAYGTWRAVMQMPTIFIYSLPLGV